MPAQAASPVILILGDSLSAGYGIDTADTWVRKLEQRLQEQGYPHRVVNASISGETTSGGRARLPALLERHRPALVLIELGGNDGLRGIAPAELAGNLSAMLEATEAAGARAVLVRMELPPNYGPAFVDRFRQAYVDVAARHGVPLAPFLLDGVALDAALMQSDGIHPEPAAAPIMLDNVWPTLATALGPP